MLMQWIEDPDVPGVIPGDREEAEGDEDDDEPT